MLKIRHLLSIATLSVLLSAIGCSSNSEQVDTATQSQPSVNAEQVEEQTSASEKEEAVADPFHEAVQEAMAASELVQEANLPEEWEVVVSKWGKAVEHLEAVSKEDENYSTAQQKIEEYQSNLDYAKQNFLDSSLGEALVDTGSTAKEIQSWIDQGADPRQVKTSVLGEPTPELYYAASFGNDSAVRVLLGNGASWDQLTADQLNDALISSSCSGFIFTVEELLKAGADPNAQNHHGEYPLQLSQSEVCQEVDMTGPIPPGTRQHVQVEAALRAAGAK